MENFKIPVPVEWNNKRVLLTAQLADAYKCSVDQIKVNFNANKKHYKEGLHYFKIAGKELEELRVRNPYLQISSMTRTLYLWTEQGAVRHCKSINTPEAWEMFDELEENYFNYVVETAPVPAVPVEKTCSKLVACVYILLLSSGLVKIGHTDKVGKRATVIERETNSTVGKLYCTFLMARDKACSIERICQKNFSSYRVNGEFFNADFSEVRNFLKSLVEIEVERNNGLLKIADMMDSSPERQAILIQAANFYVGKILV